MKRREKCSECNRSVSDDDPYFATPCGTFCSECMEDKHAKQCGICASEFDLREESDEPVVTWKSETDTHGQTYVLTQGRPFSWPWGQLPDGCIDHGRKTKEEARELAVTLGFKFEES